MKHNVLSMSISNYPDLKYVSLHSLHRLFTVFYNDVK